MKKFKLAEKEWKYALLKAPHIQNYYNYSTFVHEKAKGKFNNIIK